MFIEWVSAWWFRLCLDLVLLRRFPGLEQRVGRRKGSSKAGRFGGVLLTPYAEPCSRDHSRDWVQGFLSLGNSWRLGCRAEEWLEAERQVVKERWDSGNRSYLGFTIDTFRLSRPSFGPCVSTSSYLHLPLSSGFLSPRILACLWGWCRSGGSFDSLSFHCLAFCRSVAYLHL